MNMKTFGVAGALLALALMIGLVVGTNTISAKKTPPGSVFITGHDPDYHSQDPSCSGAGAERLLTAAIDFATNSSANPLLVVYTDSPTDPAGHRDSIAGLEKVTTNFVRMNATQFATANLTPYEWSAIFVPSDFGGQLRQEELDALNAREKDIRRYINQGGGLIALAESNGGDGLTDQGLYEFVPGSVTSTAAGHKFGDKVTEFGEELGLTDADVTCNYSHNYFDKTAGMKIVDYVDDDSSEDFNPAKDKIMSLAHHGYFGPDGVIVPDEDGKVLLCHFTGNTADPWEIIRVPYNAVASHIPGHDDDFPDYEGNCPPVED
jgi:hypothetical protein